MADTYKIKNITVRQKIATGDDTYIVCGNSDYTVHWDLDDEWAEYNEKTMLVRVDNSPNPYTVQFTGTDAELPALYNTRRCVIGLMAGDVRTTTGAMFVCLPSVRDASGVPVEPPADVYAQLAAQLASKISEPSQDGTAGQALITDGKGGRSWGDVAGGGSELPEVSSADAYRVLGVEYDTENGGYRWGVTPAARIVKVVKDDNNLWTPSGITTGDLITEAQYKTTILLYNGYYYYCSSEPAMHTYYIAFRRVTAVANVPKLQFSYFDVSPRYTNIGYYDWADVTPAGVDGITPHIGDNGNWYLGDTDTGVAAAGAKGDKGDKGNTGPQGPAGAPGKDGAGMDITGATVGQIAKITAVDSDGKPTAWEAVDMPNGGAGFTVILEQLFDDATAVSIDDDGSYNEIIIELICPPGASAMFSKWTTVLGVGNKLNNVAIANASGNNRGFWLYVTRCINADGVACIQGLYMAATMTNTATITAKFAFNASAAKMIIGPTATDAMTAGKLFSSGIAIPAGSAIRISAR